MANKSLAVASERPFNVGMNVRKRLQYYGHIDPAANSGEWSTVPMRKQNNHVNRESAFNSNSLN